MIVHNPDSTCRTGLFTDSTANTAYRTLFFCLSSFAFVRTFDYNIIGTLIWIISCGQTFIHFPQARHLSSSTSATPYSFREIAPNLHTLTQAPQPMQPSVHPSSPCTALHPPLHATRADLYGNLFFAAISTLPFVWCICKRQIISANSIITEICICNCRCSRNGCDLSNADGTACNLQSWFIYNDCFYFGNFM